MFYLTTPAMVTVGPATGIGVSMTQATASLNQWEIVTDFDDEDLTTQVVRGYATFSTFPVSEGQQACTVNSCT
jgi:hypothetical protein